MLVSGERYFYFMPLLFELQRGRRD